MKRLALVAGFLLLASVTAYANHGVVGQLNSGPVTWGSASIFSTDGGVCVLLDAGTNPSSDAVPTTPGSGIYDGTCQISSIQPTNATVTACLYGSTDNGQTWKKYGNSCYTFAALDGGVDGGGWQWAQGYVDPLTQIQTTNTSDGGMLCCTYSAQ